MNFRTRLWVVVITAPVIAFIVIGGFLGHAIARDDEPYQHLRVFEDVVSLISNNYVEEVDLSRVMTGAMRGLAESLDPDSAYLTAEQVRRLERNEQAGSADIGVQLTRQYYLRVIAARDGSPAARAGLRSGDYIRTIDGESTRELSALEGMRLLRGAPGSSVKLTIIRGSAADPHDVAIARGVTAGPDVTSRVLPEGPGYVRIAGFGRNVVEQLGSRIAEVSKAGAASLVIDLRGTAEGDMENGVSAARLFVASGALAIRAARGTERQVLSAAGGDGRVTMPVVLLVDIGTAGAAEVFASSLVSAGRADLVGEKTLGRATVQKLVKLPDGSGLWISGAQYLTRAGDPIQGKGLTPTIEVERPDVEFGAAPPVDDPILDRAIAHLAVARAA
jgi:carboxyl-terminal processing protease